jgi:hypothetical protein
MKLNNKVRSYISLVKTLNDHLVISQNGPNINSFDFFGEALKEWKHMKQRKIYSSYVFEDTKGVIRSRKSKIPKG